ncbi:hypothetical protein BDW74DRAFT_172809 [Aspergillus multicolor]|uniref:shikimate dehydrogenase family protein n=1 Tax=Aspergillus multicolor TaxID=41759 RepID=UPI003CCD9725
MTTEQKKLHLVGVGVTHSIAPAMHNSITQSLALPWTFHATECPTLSDLLALARQPKTAGLVVTMPYKNSVMPHLDELDELATTIGACNNIYYKTEETKGPEPGQESQARRLCGTNTDWRGIKGCLLEKGDDESSRPRPSPDSPGTALIVGAGGASRAAVYAISQHLHCSTIYILNRDRDEVQALIRDAGRLPSTPEIIHIETLDAALSIPEALRPYYIVGTVPDLEPRTDAEKTVAAVLEWFLSQPQRGVLLDMCFKPRRTRMIRLAEARGWPAVEGTHVIGYQIEEQWRLWAGEERVGKLDRDGAWRVLLRAAEESTAIN